MTRAITTLIVIGLLGCDPNQTAHHEFQEGTIGLSGNDVAEAGVPTRDGGYLLAGQTNSLRGNPDVYVVKTDRYQRIQWSKAFGGSWQDGARSVRVLKNGDYLLTGYIAITSSNRDAYVVRMNDQGEVLWSRHFGGLAADEAFDALEMPHGDLILAGQTASYGAGGVDGLIIRLNAAGSLIWIRTYGGSSDDRFESLAAVSDSDFVAAGASGSDAFAWIQKVNVKGEIVWSQVYAERFFNEIHTIRKISGGFIVAAHTIQPGRPGDVDGWLFQINEAGLPVWSQTYGTTMEDRLFTVTPAIGGGFLAVGRTYENNHVAQTNFSDYQVYVVRTDGFGNTLWTRTFGSTWNDEIVTVEAVGTDGYLLTGYSQTTKNGPSDMYVIRLNRDGEVDP